ncbi:MAG TPA: hypothetical protein DDZ80_23215 [Cyanobacteria bacterium UBA8803]|nr:hypothetical protein [Cyanobacteria bacterium UBA9273]HBL61237.1 hypothetical protein [Cyanobacteria bacterium UBA8803]
MKPTSHYLNIATKVIGSASCLSLTSTLATPLTVQAQIIPNPNPPATTNSVVTDVGGGVNEITGGITIGGNLFHSFQEFSIDGATITTAHFLNDPAIKNIISRVTGGSISTINGTIQAEDAANLFLINPQGIVFGSNAQLNIGGSFVASTANSLKFDDGSEFSATNPQSPPLLAINVPVGLQYGGNTGPIQVQGSFLKVPDGQTLALIGGSVSLDRGILSAPRGRVELGGLAGVGTVPYADGSLSFPDGVARTNISLTNQSSVDVTGANGGSIAINASQIDLLGGSTLASGIPDFMAGALPGITSDIVLNATGAINIVESDITNNVYSEAIGDGGDIIINADSLSVTNSSLDAGTFGKASAGNIVMRVNGAISLQGARLFSDVATDEEEVDGGDIDIQAGSLSLTDGTELIAKNQSSGLAGNVFINAREKVSIENSSITNTSNNDNDTDFSFISILAPEGSVYLNQAELNSTNNGSGYGGDIILNASNQVSIINQSTISSQGLQGRILIGQSEDSEEFSSPRSVLIDNATLTSSNFGEGDAGKILIDAGETVNIANSFINSDAIQNGSDLLGQAGLIEITANERVNIANSSITADSSGFSETSYTISEESAGQEGGIFIGSRNISLNSSFLSSTAFGSGYAGSITLFADDKVAIADSQLFSDAVSNDGQSGGYAGFIGIAGSNSVSVDNSLVTADSFGSIQGEGLASGEIEITGGAIAIQNHSAVSASIFNAGVAGSVFINAGDKLSLANSTLESNSEGIIGDAGNINISARWVDMNRGEIQASSVSGNGGNITLIVSDLVLLRNQSLIRTDAGTEGNPGDGGFIDIDPKFVIGVNNSDITANAFDGFGGFIRIQATEGIFGLKVRRNLTPDNDITAISQQNPQLDGDIEISSPDVDPSSGLQQLSANFVDAASLVAQDLCKPKEQQSAFTVTGRGGLPPNPYEVLAPDAVFQDWAAEESEGVGERSQSSVIKDKGGLNPHTRQIVEAQGWIVAADGTVILTSNPPHLTPHTSGFTSPGCR